MSNHTGSYILNELLKLLKDKYDFFTFLGEEKTLSLLKHIVATATEHWDCNEGEILEDIGQELGICYCCVAYAELTDEDICTECAGEFSDED